MVKKSSQTYAEFSSGLQLYGLISQVLKDSVGNVIYLRSHGPSSLAYVGNELLGHGEDVHAEGFGSPVGLIRGFSNCLSTYSLVELDQFGVCLGRDVRLEYRLPECLSTLNVSRTRTLFFLLTIAR
jgi:phenylalanine-4-hydroxylase